jgi:hypothetical protein
LPRSISGLWKADLFLGNSAAEQWVGTTVKINPTHLQGAPGLRIGIYPRVNAADRPRKDDDLNIIRLPLPYDGAFMELFYKAFFLVRAFMNADARVPPPVRLPDAEDRFITQELEARRIFGTLAVVEAIRDMSQRTLLQTAAVADVQPTATLSEEEGLRTDAAPIGSSLVSLTPESRET